MDKRTKGRIATISNYQTVFNSHVGGKVLWDIMKQGNILNVSHTAGDPYATAFEEGRRSLALFILEKLKTDTKKLEQQFNNAETLEDIEL